MVNKLFPAAIAEEMRLISLSFLSTPATMAGENWQDASCWAASDVGQHEKEKTKKPRERLFVAREVFDFAKNSQDSCCERQSGQTPK